jgi:hypothetical protein
VFVTRMLTKKRKTAQPTLASFAGFAFKKEPARMSPINEIPSSILRFCILSRLPLQELRKARSVCRNWSELASPRSFLPYFFSYQRLKCGSEPIINRASFPSSFESLMRFDPQEIIGLGSLPSFSADDCVEYVFDSNQTDVTRWMLLTLSIFMCKSPERLRLLLSSFSHGACLELISFMLACDIIAPCCFGRFSHRIMYLFENFLHSLINEPSVSAESFRIPSASDRCLFASFKKHTPSKPFTREQRALVEASPSSARVLLAACFAGCGKTSTLVEYALARPNTRILYLCFNKSVQLHASNLFSQTNVCCKTLHSLAWESTGAQYRHKLQPSLRFSDVMRVMSVPATLAAAARAVVLNFLCSCDDHIAASHLNGASNGEVGSDEACKLASEIWVKMCDVKDLSLPMLHSGYLKLYASRRPVINFDLIMIDEAQDCDPVTMQACLKQTSTAPTCTQSIASLIRTLNRLMQVISYQKVPKIFVGDSHQQIYRFRGAVDAMKQVDAAQTLRLSQTFRFGARPSP